MPVSNPAIIQANIKESVGKEDIDSQIRTERYAPPRSLHSTEESILGQSARLRGFEHRQSYRTIRPLSWQTRSAWFAFSARISL